MNSAFIKKCVLGLLALYGVWGAFHPQLFLFIDGVNLLFHEAGHVLFAFFGPVAGIWGGTLLQLLIPGGLAAGFLGKGEKFSAGVCFFWMGQNLIPISAYIKDARSQILPYVGGETHDWAFILARAGLLDYDQTIGTMVWCTGIIVMVTACLSGIMILSRRPRISEL